MKASTLSYGFAGSMVCFALALRWIPSLVEYWEILTGIGGVCALMLAFLSRGKSALVIAITLGMLLGLHTGLRARTALEPAALLAWADDQKHTLLGSIDSLPDRRPKETRYIVHVKSIDGEKTSGRILTYDRSGFPEYHYGDRVSIEGKINAPEVLSDFDYPAFLKTQHIDALMGFAALKKEPPHALSVTEKFFRALFRVRTALESRINLLLPEPHSSLLIGFITGSRSGLSDRIVTEFRVTGTSHIVAVSGYNVTLVLAILSSLLFWLPIKKRFLPLGLGIVVYMLLTGAGAPVVRASIMGFLGLIALQSNRQSTPRLALLWTAFFMTLIDPLDLWYDPGFQLSFLAVLGITELTPFLNRVFKKIPTTLGVRESLIATVAAQIATLPVSALTFRQFSLIAPITNLLVAPMIPLSMASGFLAVLLSLLSFPLGLLVAYCAWAFLQWILLAVHVTSLIPWAQFVW